MFLHQRKLSRKQSHSFGKFILKNQQGYSLLETVLALALFGIVSVAFLTALSTVWNVLFLTNERETAKNLAESQMEYVENHSFETSYDPDTVPSEFENAGYVAKILPPENIASRDTNIQLITVIIEHHGREVLRLEGYKGK